MRKSAFISTLNKQAERAILAKISSLHKVIYQLVNQHLQENINMSGLETETLNIYQIGFKGSDVDKNCGGLYLAKSKKAAEKAASRCYKKWAGNQIYASAWVDNIKEIQKGLEITKPVNDNSFKGLYQNLTSKNHTPRSLIQDYQDLFDFRCNEAIYALYEDTRYYRHLLKLNWGKASNEYLDLFKNELKSYSSRANNGNFNIPDGLYEALKTENNTLSIAEKVVVMKALRRAFILQDAQENNMELRDTNKLFNDAITVIDSKLPELSNAFKRFLNFLGNLFKTDKQIEDNESFRSTSASLKKCQTTFFDSVTSESKKQSNALSPRACP